jgi:ribosomal protein S18 acetylase RimI-like enzyme
MWFRHVASTSWLAETPDGRPVGFLLGFVSPDRPSEGLLHLVAVDPNQRRRGIGRALVERFADDAAERGAATITAIAWPGEPPAIAFFEATGFAAQGGPGSQRIHGTIAFPDYDGEGDDRIVFVRTA